MGRLLDRLHKKIEEQKNQTLSPDPEAITQITLAEFALRNIAVEIYSEVLGCVLWLCSDEEMKSQVMRDAPGQVCYTVRELRNLLKLDPPPEDIKKIHECKKIFSNSTIRSTNKRIKI